MPKSTQPRLLPKLEPIEEGDGLSFDDLEKRSEEDQEAEAQATVTERSRSTKHMNSEQKGIKK